MEPGLSATKSRASPIPHLRRFKFNLDCSLPLPRRSRLLTSRLSHRNRQGILQWIGRFPLIFLTVHFLVKTSFAISI